MLKNTNTKLYTRNFHKKLPTNDNNTMSWIIFSRNARYANLISLIEHYHSFHQIHWAGVPQYTQIKHFHSIPWWYGVLSGVLQSVWWNYLNANFLVYFCQWKTFWWSSLNENGHDDFSLCAGQVIPLAFNDKYSFNSTSCAIWCFWKSAQTVYKVERTHG